MKKLLAGLIGALALAGSFGVAHAEDVTVVSSCGSVTLATGYAAAPLTQDTTGRLCSAATSSFTPSGTQDVNITQTGGASVARGAGTAATALRVELPTDGTGKVGLNAGSAVIGHVIADSGSTTAVTGTVASTQSGTWTVQPGNTANTTAWKVDGSAVTQPVSAASLPLPSGASTSALQSATQAPITPATATATTSTLTGCTYNSTIVTFTNAQQGGASCGSRGAINVQIMGIDSASGVGVSAAADGSSNANVSFLTASRNSVYNNSTWDRARSITGADGTGLGIAAIAASPNSNVNSGIVPVVSTTLESCHVMKASAGNLYSMAVVIQATTGIVQLFNATSAPADGAVTPIWSMPVTSNGTLGGASWEWTIPMRFSTGITACFSSATTPFTKTASATAMLTANVQ